MHILAPVEQLTQLTSAQAVQTLLISEYPKFLLQDLKHCPSVKVYPVAHRLHSKSDLLNPSSLQVTQLEVQSTHNPA